MKRALILGITGSFGSHIARELLSQGYALTALVRDPDILKASTPNVTLIQGDMTDRDAIRRAAKGNEIMVYGISPANYNWKNKAIPWLENAIRVAEQLKMTVLFPGNVYIYDPNEGPDFTEQSTSHPITEKGQTRDRMEKRLAEATHRGAQVIIIRAGDFIAADSNSSWLNRLIRKKKNGYHITLPGPADIKHTWAYLPDLARSAVSLIENRAALGQLYKYNFTGYQLSFNDMLNSIQQHTGKKVTHSQFPWWFIRLSSPFSILLQGLIEMRYLWEYEVNLKNAQHRTFANEVQPTPFCTALLKAGII